MAEPEQSKTGEELTKAYERMLGQVHEGFQSAEEQTVPQLRRLLDEVRDKAVEWGELTREEAERVAGYLERAPAVEVLPPRPSTRSSGSCTGLSGSATSWRRRCSS